jgi:hypothetical protein
MTLWTGRHRPINIAKPTHAGLNGLAAPQSGLAHSPDGGLQIVYGEDWLLGQFDGATFHGQLDIIGRFGSLGCTYTPNPERTGS